MLANTVVHSAFVLDACCMQRPLKRKVCWFQKNFQKKKNLSFWFWEDHQGPGLTSVLGGTPAVHRKCLFKVQERCPIGTERLNSDGKNTQFYKLIERVVFKKISKVLEEKKGERIWDANTCFTAQRPHRYSLAMWLVILHGMEPPESGFKLKKEKGETHFVLLV